MDYVPQQTIIMTNSLRLRGKVIFMCVVRTLESVHQYALDSAVWGEMDGNLTSNCGSEIIKTIIYGSNKEKN